jgi:endoglucanase
MKRTHRVPRAAAPALTLLAAFAGNALAQTADPGPAVKVNQVAYVPGAPKRATVVSSSSSPLAWVLRTASGATAASGQTTVRGADASSGDNLHVVDFSSVDSVGTGYVLSVGGINSFPFDISADPIRRLRYDALAFFYHQRSGTPILAQLVGTQYARPAGHINVAPNRGDNAVPCRVSCGYTLDVRGGWYDAGDHGKYVVNGGISAWQLINEYERTLHVAGADRAGLADGTLAIPERGNGVPDILDEARWEVEFLLKMQVPDGRPLAGMAHHKIHDQNWTGLPMRPEADSQARLLSAPSTAATLNLAAVAAQAARVWRTIDPTFSARALAAAEKAYAAAKANPSRLADPNDGTGGGAYSDNDVNDEFFWAAAELYVTTGAANYRADVAGSSLFRGGSFALRGFDWGSTGGLGDITLSLVPNGLAAADIAATRAALVAFADRVLAQANAQGYPAPLNAYDWGSNGQVANNATVIALAFDFTGQQKYREGVYQALDYLLGRNPLAQSYVAGYGEKASRNMHHRFWANQLNGSLPTPPAGSIAGGPNTALQDPLAQARLGGCRAQKCYVDHIDAYSLNEVAINWNSGLAWIAHWAAEKAGGTSAPVDSPPSAPGQPTASGITATGASLSWPAATDDRGVAGYDVVRIQGTSQTLLATATAASATLGGLIANTDYVVAIRARDTAGQVSALSPTRAFRTSAGTTPTDTPPTTPGQPAAAAITATGASLSWTASTDDRGVAGYDVLRIQGTTQTVLATSTGTSAALTGLTAATDYVVAVRARDTAGQTSALSTTRSFRTSAGTTTPAGSCTVTYTPNSWNTGFTASVRITNTSGTAWNGWTLRFSFPGDQRVTGFWESVITQAAGSRDVVVTNVGHNGNVAPNASATFGFQGTHGGTNASPAAFSVNGVSCN